MASQAEPQTNSRTLMRTSAWGRSVCYGVTEEVAVRRRTAVVKHLGVAKVKETPDRIRTGDLPTADRCRNRKAPSTIQLSQSPPPDRRQVTTTPNEELSYSYLLAVGYRTGGGNYLT